MLRVIAFTTIVAAASPALAEWTPVPGRVLKDMVAGSTVVIDAPMGFKLPIKHSDDGTMTGTAGGLSFYLGASADSGQWWVERERLCYKWARWFKSETRCMKVRQDGGTRIQWEKDDGETGTATVTVAARPKPAPAPVNIAASTPPAAAAPSAPARQPNAAPPRVASTAAAPSPRNAPAVAAKPVAAAPKAKSTTPPPANSVARNDKIAMAAAAKPAPAAPQTRDATPTPNTRIAAAAAVPPYRVGAPPPPAYRVISVASDDVLNVRGGPSMEHMPVAALSPDATDVQILGPCRSEWCFVRHGEIVGWVNTYYLEEIANAAR